MLIIIIIFLDLYAKQPTVKVYGQAFLETSDCSASFLIIFYTNIFMLKILFLRKYKLIIIY